MKRKNKFNILFFLFSSYSLIGRFSFFGWNTGNSPVHPKPFGTDRNLERYNSRVFLYRSIDWYEKFQPFRLKWHETDHFVQSCAQSARPKNPFAWPWTPIWLDTNWFFENFFVSGGARFSLFYFLFILFIYIFLSVTDPTNHLLKLKIKKPHPNSFSLSLSQSQIIAIVAPPPN